MKNSMVLVALIMSQLFVACASRNVKNTETNENVIQGAKTTTDRLTERNFRQ